MAQANYDQNAWDGMERFTNGWYENMLVQQWLPTMPDVQERLTRGVSVADIGCGRGRGVIKLAQSFPRSHYVGYDVFQRSIDRAKANAQAAGVAANDSVLRTHAERQNTYAGNHLDTGATQ